MTRSAKITTGRRAVESDAVPERHAFWLVFAVQAFAVIVPAGAFAWLIRLLIDRSPIRGAWTIQIMIALATLLASCWGAIQRRRLWEGPTRQLIRLIGQAQRGEAPIEELNTVAGGIAPVVPLIQGLLHDLKQQRAEIQKLNEEMRQRVAVRTDALERKIGSLQLQAMRDVLSGLYNRRALETELPRVVEAYRAGGPGACVLMIDVDHFKQLNDTLGHAAGDRLLKEIGQIIRSTLRDEDLGFRHGGDEFVVLLNDCRQAEGQTIATRLEGMVQALTRPLRVPMPPQLSIGVCGLEELQDPTTESLLQTADQRLYAVKATKPRTRGSVLSVKRAG
jgi:diguanylate cyclase (GGDEF)-like protein